MIRVRPNSGWRVSARDRQRLSPIPRRQPLQLSGVVAVDAVAVAGGFGIVLFGYHRGFGRWRLTCGSPVGVARRALAGFPAARW